MNVLKKQIKRYRNLLIYKSIALLVLLLILVFGAVFVYSTINSNNKKSMYLEHKISFAETKQHRLIFENSLIFKAESMYNNALLQKDLTIGAYINSLRDVIQSVSNYYRIFYPIQVKVSYSKAETNEVSLVPIKVSIKMLNIFDYTPIRLIYILFNNTFGTMNCRFLSISRQYSGDMFDYLLHHRYLFSSEFELDWFVPVKTVQEDFNSTFFINYRKVKDLEKIEHMYNMSTWNESLMLFPGDIDKLKDIQNSFR